MPVYPVPNNVYMGIHVTPTVDGNVTVGPDAENTDKLDDYTVPQKNIEELAASGTVLWPHIHKKDQIRTFAGIQPKLVDENGTVQMCIRDSSYLEDLAAGRFSKITQEAGISKLVQRRCLEAVRHLDPHPAAAFTGEMCIRDSSISAY